MSIGISLICMEYSRSRALREEKSLLVTKEMATPFRPNRPQRPILQKEQHNLNFSIILHYSFDPRIKGILCP